MQILFLKYCLLKKYTIYFMNMLIFQSQSVSTWTYDSGVVSTPRDQVESNTALDNFRVWVSNNHNSLPGHDHAMLFTG